MKLVVSALDARSKRRRAALAKLETDLDHFDLGSPSSPEVDATEALERLHNDAVGPLNVIKLQGQEEGTVDDPYDPAELPAVAKAGEADGDDAETLMEEATQAVSKAADAAAK